MIIKTLFLIVAVLMLTTVSANAQCGTVTIEPIRGSAGGVLFPGDTIELGIRFTVGDEYLTGYTHAFALWSEKNGQYGTPWTRLYGDGVTSTGAITTGMFDAASNFFTAALGYAADGIGRDSVRMGGYALFSAGIPPGFDEIVAYIPLAGLTEGEMFCIDSAAMVSTYIWTWSAGGGPPCPAWDAPYCFPITCCKENRGNIDLMGGTNISDVTTLVRYIFPPHDSLYCATSGDVNGDETTNIIDLTYLIDYMFRGGEQPPACPEY